MRGLAVHQQIGRFILMLAVACFVVGLVSLATPPLSIAAFLVGFLFSALGLLCDPF